MNISVCIDAVYKDKPFADGLAEIASAGVRTFEFWSWWNKDIAQICKTKEQLDLTCAALCTHFISLVDTTQRNEYLHGLQETIKVAKKLDCKTIISQVGDDTGRSRAEQKQSLIDGLKAAAPLLEAADMQLVFEPLNVLVDHPGYFLTHSNEAFEVAEAINRPCIKVLFDIYHQQITEGNVIGNITGNIGQIGHFHAAGNPGRHELTIGELNYDQVFNAIDATEYPGFIGLEYYPVGDPTDSIRMLALSKQS